MAYHAPIGLVPGSMFGSSGKFELKETGVDVSSRGCLVDTKAVFKYTLTADSDVEAHFRFPYVINEVPLTVYHVSASVQQLFKPDINITVDVRKPTEVSADVAAGRIPLGAVALTSQADHWQARLGPVPPEATVHVTVHYVSPLDHERDGKPFYTFPDVLKGQSPLSILEVWFHDCSSISDENQIESSFTWTKSRGTPGDLHLSTMTGRTDFDLKGEVWGWRGQGRLKAEYEPSPADIDTGDRAGLLTLSLTAPPACHGAGSSLVSSQVEVLFFVDRSGSMHSNGRLQHASETLLLFIKSLPVGCYFNVIGFGTSYDTLFPGGSSEYGEHTLRQAMQYQSQMDANMGGTRLNEPLSSMMKKPVQPGCRRIVFVMTDGHVHDDDACIATAKRHASTTRIFSFGIGESVSRQFVQELAEAGGGAHEFTTSSDRDMETRVMRTLHEALAANMAGLTWRLELPRGLTADARQLPRHAHPGQTLDVTLEIKGSAKPAKRKESPPQVSVVVESGEQQNSFSCPLDMDETCASLSVHRSHAANTAKDLTNNAADAGVDQAQERASDTLLPLGVFAPFLSVVSTREGPGAECGEIIGYSSNSPAFGVSQLAPVQPARPAPAQQPPGGLFGRLGKRRLRPVLRDNIQGIHKSVIRRIGARGGVSRISRLVTDEIRYCLKEFMTRIIRDAVTYTDHERRRTVKEEDVDKALKNNGIKLYGIEDYAPARFEGEPNTKRRTARRVVRRTTPFGRPDATTSSVASMLGVTRNDSQTGLATPQPPRKQRSTASNSSTSAGSRLQKQSTLILKDPSATVSSLAAVFVHISPPVSRSASTTGGRLPSRQPSAQSLASTSTVQVAASRAPGRGRKRRGHADPTSEGTAPTAKAGRVDTEAATEATAPGRGRGKGKVATGRRGRKGKALAAPLRTATTTRSRASASSSRPGLPDFQAMIGLISLQQFDGHWSVSKELEKLLNKPITGSCLTQPPVKDHEVWATALAATWLETRYPGQRTEWEMIHYKALKFMETHDSQGLSVTELQQKAANFLK